MLIELAVLLSVSLLALHLFKSLNLLQYIDSLCTEGHKEDKKEEAVESKEEKEKEKKKDKKKKDKKSSSSTAEGKEEVSEGKETEKPADTETVSKRMQCNV